MAEPTDIWLNGTVDFGLGHTDGDDIVVVSLTDDDGRPYRMFYRKAAFVTIADHCKMLADEITAGRLDFPRP